MLMMNNVSSTPFVIKAVVNGVDPSAQTAVLRAGDEAEVSIDVAVSQPNVLVYSVEFFSIPSSMAGVLEAFLEKRVTFPRKLESFRDTGYYLLPSFLPNGFYGIIARIHYGGVQQGIFNYKARIKIENRGLLSYTLGILMKFLPKTVVKMVARSLL
jgi:hypothetical protein